MFAYLSERSIG